MYKIWICTSFPATLQVVNDLFDFGQLGFMDNLTLGDHFFSQGPGIGFWV